jgi:flavin reductase (DIM6/NTAB) family NADH-FMN oxidoreductase RutF
MDPLLFRRVMGRFATGVTVVTGLDSDGDPFGFTANSLSSVSLHPPLVSVCVDRRADSHDPLIDSGAFAVNILTDRQESVARRFASPADRAGRWEGLDWRAGPHGLPVFEGVLGWIVCRVFDTVGAGDHTLLIGAVEEADGAEGSPLLYFRGAYGRVQG